MQLNLQKMAAENFKKASEPMKQSTRMGILNFGIILVITFIAASAAFIALYYKMWITIRFSWCPKEKGFRAVWYGYHHHRRYRRDFGQYIIMELCVKKSE